MPFGSLGRKVGAAQYFVLFADLLAFNELLTGDKVTAEKCVNTISRHFSQLDRFNILKPQYPDGACSLIRAIMGGQSGGDQRPILEI